MLEFDYTDTLLCRHVYSGSCKYRAYFCVHCDVTHPRLEITLMKIELIPLSPIIGLPKGYVCTCSGSLTLPALSWRRQLIIREAYSKLLYKLLDEGFCALSVCGSDPPSGTIETILKVIDCYKYKYVPFCSGDDPPIYIGAYIAIEYCPESVAYCEYEYRVCVYIDPNDGTASPRNELIKISHINASNCADRDLVFPPGTMFPRWGDCFPDETECMSDPNCP